MLWYIENSTTKRAYADQETSVWDREAGTLPKPVLDERKAKIEAIPVKENISEKTPADIELADTLKAEALAHTLPEGKITEPSCICSWDGVSPYVIMVLGTFPKNGIPIMGWPQTDIPPTPTPMTFEIPVTIEVKEEVQ
jgi:hypothetical protein